MSTGRTRSWISGARRPGLPFSVGGRDFDAGTPLVGVDGLPAEIVSADGRTRAVVVDHSPLVDGVAAGRLRELARLVNVEDARLQRESPIAIGAGEVEIHPREHALRQRYEALAEACGQPRGLLTHRDEVVTLTRARRITARGDAWISAHPGSWVGRRGRMPLPSHVLAEQPRITVDRYENRVLAHVVVEAEHRLRTHVDDLRVKQQQISDRRRMEQKSSRRMRHRVSEIWGEVWLEDDSEAAAATLTDVLSALSTLLKKVRALSRQPGVSGIRPDRRRVSALRHTNILRGDDRYRQVAELWPMFTQQQRVSLGQRVDRQYDTLLGHHAFVRLLVLRAMPYALPDQLLDPLDEAEGEALVWSAAHVVTLRPPDGPVLDIVPQFCAVDPAQSVALLADEFPADGRARIVVTAPANGVTAGSIARSPSSSQPTIVAASPYDLDAVEVVGGLLRAHVLGGRYAALPPRVAVSPDALAALRAAGVKCEVAGRGEVIFLLETLERPALDRARERFLSKTLSRSQRQSRDRSWGDLRARLQGASEGLTRATPCPTPGCGSIGQFLDVRPARVLLGCGVCAGRWGMTHCRFGHPVPFGLSADDAETLLRLDADVQAAGRVVGMGPAFIVGVQDGHLGTPCPTCGAWTRVPLDPARS